MNVLSSLRSRIFLTSALLTVLSIGTAIYQVSVRVTRELERSAEREITATGALVERLHNTRAQTFATLARLLADAPKLKAAVDTNDPPTIQDTADDYRSELNSNLMLVTSKAGRIMATVGTPPRTGIMTTDEPSIRGALAGRESQSLLPQADGILHLVTVPITIGLTRPDVLGTLSVGFLLDDAFAAQLKETTGSDIAFSMDGRMLAATLSADDRERLASLLPSRSTREVTLASDDFVMRPVPLETSGDRGGGHHEVVAWILRSRSEQRRFLQTIHTELAITALVGIVLATILSFAVARTITRPLGDITSVMKEVAATGDLTRKIVLRRGARWNDEDARLLATTFNTLTDSIALAQREMSQKERLSSLGRLSTVIAHEVRNPLMIIKAALHTLRRDDLSAPALREAAADIDEEVARLNRLVNEVLDFARPIQFELAPLDVNQLCRECVAAATATPGAPIDTDLAAALPGITSDGERLRVALVNLLLNARQAVTSREPAGLPVRLTTRGNDREVIISVHDEGVGIPPKDLPRVFDPYFTTKRGGTGLGLPIAKNIVEGLGGTITVRSEPGLGTDIHLQLPVDAARSTHFPTDV